MSTSSLPSFGPPTKTTTGRNNGSQDRRLSTRANHTPQGKASHLGPRRCRSARVADPKRQFSHPPLRFRCRNVLILSYLQNYLDNYLTIAVISPCKFTRTLAREHLRNILS